MEKVAVYGIPNCDTTKKAVSWLKENKKAFTFHDYKQKGISKAKLDAWCKKLGWETIFNKRSTTWRALSEVVQKKVINQPAAIKLMMENNSIIKRPVIEWGNKIVIGFDESVFVKYFLI